MARNGSPLKTATKAEIKQLRSDARKLDAIANHLRQRAKDLADGLRSTERAEKARTNFFTKESKIMPGVAMTPDLPADDPLTTFERQDPKSP